LKTLALLTQKHRDVIETFQEIIVKHFTKYFRPKTSRNFTTLSTPT